MKRRILLGLSGLLLCLIPQLSAGISSGMAGTTTISNASFLPPFVGFRINDGNQFTNSIAISVEIKSLRLRDSLVTEMQIGLMKDLSDATWIPYDSEKHILNLSSGDGEKNIYARLRDAAKNTSPIESATVILDTQPPEKIEISINRGQKYTKDNQRRSMVFVLTEEEDIKEMILCNKSDFLKSDWEPFAKTKRWILAEEGGDGEKSVYMKFRDQAGNESLVFWSSIFLDTQAPKNGSIVVNDGEKFTQTRDVKLRISAEEAVRVRILSQQNSQIIPYENDEGKDYMEIEWKLDSVEGIKVVRVFFVDDAKNRTTQPIQDEINYDATPPLPPFVSINGDSKYTNHPTGNVSIKLSTKANPANCLLMISNNNDFSDCNPITFRDQFRDWQIPSEEDGMKSVYVKLIDEAGNHSEASVGKIILDREPPKVNKVFINEGVEWTNTLKVNINFEVEGASHLQINNNRQTITRMAAWENFHPLKSDWTLLPVDGPKLVFTRFKDQAGNVTEIAEATIKLDTKPPTGTLTINNGAKYTNDPERLVVLQIITPDGHGMQMTNTPEFQEVKLEPVSETIENWELPDKDGPNPVYLRLKDQAGNFSKVILSTIILDRQAPSELSMVIHEGREWLRASTRRASIGISAKGASHMMLSENPNFPNGAWAPFKNVTAWVFSEGEGIKELHVKFKDPAGNVSEAISGQIKLDYTPPLCSEFVVDGGADFTNDAQKKVKLSFKTEGAIKLATANAPITDPQAPTTLWEDFETDKDWVLEGEDGLKTVYAIFRDEAGNFSGRYTARIILDRIAPTNGSIIINNNVKYVPAGARKVSLVFSAEGASEMIVSENADFSNAKWENFVPKKVYEVSENEGSKTIYVKYKDKAGNETPLYSGAVALDTSPPIGKTLFINDDNPYTNSPEKAVMIHLEADEAVSMRISQKGSAEGQIAQGSWEAYAKEKSLTLAGGDGEKEIIAHFRDEAGNISEPVSANIILDRKPPVPVSLVIDNGTGWTNNPEKKVSLNISARDADFMMISLAGNFDSAEWVSYQEKIDDFVLPGEDGEKNIFVRFKDKTGNVSSPLSATVNLKRAF
ncbi:hypothetical protein ACFLU5_03600 [Bacteroidota bacterium]